MIKRKNKFLTFLFSLIPGAGHMHIGLMKQGLSLMGLFFTSLVLITWTRIEVLTLFLPVIWFYSFFDAHNKNSLPDQDFYRLSDSYLFHLEDNTVSQFLKGRFRPVFGVILLLIGISVLLSNFEDLLYSLFPEDLIPYQVYSLVNRLPVLFIAAIVIYAGILLVKGKKESSEEKEDTFEFPPASAASKTEQDKTE